MVIEDLDRFEYFEIWDFEDFPAYLVATDKASSRLFRLSLDSKESKLIVSSPSPRTMPESSPLVSKEKAFEMLIANEFPSK